MSEDIRWKQRFNNYSKALQLLESCIPANPAEPTHKDILAMVQAFEMVVELAWNLIKDYMQAQGLVFQPTPKAVVREAFNKKIIPDGQVWLDAIKERNLAAHTYNEEIAHVLINEILQKFLPAFRVLNQIFIRYLAEN